MPAAIASKLLLDALSPADRAALLAKAVQREHPAGKTLLNEADLGTDIYFMLSGRVVAKSYGNDGEEITYAEICQGDCFGEFSALDGIRRSASITALSPAKIAVLTARQLEEVMQAHPGIAIALARHMVGKLRSLSERVAEFSTMTVPQRVRLLLWRLAKGPSRSTAGPFVLKPAPTHRSMAAMISTQREAVSREISRLERDGVLTSGRMQITIHDAERLYKLIKEP